MAVVQRIRTEAEPANERVAIGNNRPPMDIDARAAFDDTLKQRDGFLERIDTLLAATIAWRATDEQLLAIGRRIR